MTYLNHFPVFCAITQFQIFRIRNPTIVKSRLQLNNYKSQFWKKFLPVLPVILYLENLVIYHRWCGLKQAERMISISKYLFYSHCNMLFDCQTNCPSHNSYVPRQKGAQILKFGRDRMVVGFATTCAISAYHN